MKKLVFAMAIVGLIAGDASISWAQETMTDAKIMKMMKTVHESELDLAKMAKYKAENKEVKDFVNNMIEGHKKSEKEEKALMKKVGVKSENSTAAKDFEHMAEAKEKDLKKLKGKEFDKAYIEQQISIHQQMLDDLNQKLIPAAQNPEIKTYLEARKTRVEKTISRAQEIQTNLNH